MGSSRATTSRRELLVGLGAAAGATAAGRVVFAQGSGPAAVIALRLRDVRHAVPGATPGVLHVPGSLAAPFGRIEDTAGRHRGELRSTIVPGAPEASVLHTLTLDDGTLLAIGPHALDGPYAVVGGSGRYERATGSYTPTPIHDLHGEAYDLSITLHAKES